MKDTLIVTKNDLSTEFVFEFFQSYHKELKAYIYSFDIWKEGDEIETSHRFNFMLRIMENDKDLKVVDLFANRYKGCGISKAIILKSKDLFNKRIISCSNKFPTYIGEQNWEEAILKVWRPMVNKGLANYNTEGDYYYVI
jgi:hypothetical protein